MKKLIIISSICFAFTLSADEIVHKFKSPSFSGLGQSSHYLTIENQEKSRRDKIAQDIEDRIAKAEREANNTTLAKFLRNVESRSCNGKFLNETFRFIRSIGLAR